MSRIAVLSDIHGDLPTLLDALATIERLGIEEVWCAGDLVDEGPDPDGVARSLELRGIPTVLGNHDRWALDRRATRSHELNLATWAFLESLPRSWWSSRDGVRVAMFHGSPRGDMDALLPEAVDASIVRRHLDRADADVLVVGHTHVPMLMHVGDRLLVNPGALRRGEHVASNRLVRGGTFGVLDVGARTFQLHDALGVVVPIARTR